ncbi:hypothetical protein ABBQ38_004143 [Trebouxia sp. C0009 RCD-2024]
MHPNSVFDSIQMQQHWHIYSAQQSIPVKLETSIKQIGLKMHLTSCQIHLAQEASQTTALQRGRHKLPTCTSLPYLLTDAQQLLSSQDTTLCMTLHRLQVNRGTHQLLEWAKDMAPLIK